LLLITVLTTTKTTAQIHDNRLRHANSQLPPRAIATLACIFSLLLTLSGAQEELTSNHRQCLDETLALENNTILTASKSQLDCNIPDGSDSCAVDFSSITLNKPAATFLPWQ
jgi:hypothetical protein